MRLLNVKSGALEEFSAAKIPKYAILSHTWGDDEVTFQDLYRYQNGPLLNFSLNLFSASDPESRPSYAKIRNARNQADKDGLAYLWADTCCIDKSSSAELSEAINSMYRFYSQATVCYAYLQDAPEGFPHKQAEDVVEDLTDLASRKFISCRWFSRGWALQELLAPRKVTFYGGRDWRLLGTKETLADWIVLATGIDRETLLDPSQLRKISVARRMSWAANRQTTRIEDIAYCLLGIFGVNMPLLYGEGENAFIRLQEEIMKFSDDQSLFAWQAIPQTKSAAYGIFAKSPKQFENSGTIVPLHSERSTSPFVMTNRGLQIDLPMIPFESDYLDEAGDKVYLGVLDCQYEDDFSTCLAITLKQTQTPRVYVRIEGEEGSLIKITPQKAVRAVPQTLFIPRNYELMSRAYMNCQVQCESLKEHGYALAKVLRPKSQSKSRWNPETQVMRIEAADEYGSREFLPHVTFIFRNRNSGIGFAIRLELNDSEGIKSTRISRLRQQSHDYAFYHKDVLASYLNAAKGFAGSVSLLSGALPENTRGLSRSSSSRSSLTKISARSMNPIEVRLASRENLARQDTSDSDYSMSSSTISLDRSRGWQSGERFASNALASGSRLTKPGSQDDATGATILSQRMMRNMSLQESSDEDDEAVERIAELLKTKKEILESYCTTFAPTYDMTSDRKVVLRLPKDKIWKTWTVDEKQFKKMLNPFNDEWYRILEQDAEKSEPKTYIEHHESLEDGSQQRLDIAAKVVKQNIFGQQLHVLTVSMDFVRAFEMG